MLSYTILYYTMLRYTILYYTTLYYAIPHLRGRFAQGAELRYFTTIITIITTININ